jgi:GTP cyclohydrolase II
MLRPIRASMRETAQIAQRGTEAPRIRVRNRIAIPILDGRSRGLFCSFVGFGRYEEHFAIAIGEPAGGPPLVRIHSECITGDVFGSELCDCGKQLREAMDRLDAEGGYLLYLRQEGRGIGLYAKLDAYELQANGLDTFEANRRLNLPDDARDFGCAAEMLRALGAARIRLLTNNPAKVEQLAAHGIEVAEVVSTGVFASPHNRRYLEAKTRHRHRIELDRPAPRPNMGAAYRV